MDSAHSCLYRGWVRHERRGPVRNAFVYPTFMAFLSLNELPALERQLAGFSANRFAPFWLRRQDHAGDPAETLQETVATALTNAGVDREPADVRLLTNLRMWGHCFNPISVYYCYDATAPAPYTAVLEVTNTPWGQRHLYVIPLRDQTRRYSFDKEFHVSPFFPLDMTYDSFIAPPGERLQFAVNNRQQGRCVHRASLVLEREPLTSGRLWHRALGEVSATARNVGRIYWQATRLWFKGATFHRHPGPAASGNASR